MNDLIERLGIPMFIQITIECWNELFLLLLIIVMQVGKYKDKSDELASKVKIPMTNELLIFYAAIFLYNFTNIITLIYGGHDTAASYYVMRIGVFCYYLVGAFQTVFFLEVIKTHIAKKNSNKRLERVITAFQLLEAPNLLLLLITPFTEALYFIDAYNEYNRSWGYYVWQGITIVTFALIGAVVLLYRKKTDQFIKRIIAVAVVFPMLGFLMSFFPAPFNFNNIMVSVSELLMFMLYEKNKTDVTIRTAYELEKSKQELEQSKVRLLVAQIQPHFIYNSLMALQAKSIDNPVVYEGIKNFGDYLRSNFTAMTDNELIPFEEELKSIKAYLRLERLNFGDKMKIKYDLEINSFMLPALCVEPLVENAVRYGIGTYAKGGTVQIIVRDENDYIEIEVKDDGSGGNKLTDAQKNRKSIGLENVRLRLKASGMGELLLSQDETGTSAIVRIKYREV